MENLPVYRLLPTSKFDRFQIRNQLEAKSWFSLYGIDSLPDSVYMW